VQMKYTSLEAAKAKVKQLIDSGAELEDNMLQIILDHRTMSYYVEDGVPMIRNFEQVLWSL
jgi:hypothetical protein